MYISKTTAYIVSAIMFFFAVAITFKLMANGDSMDKDKSNFLNALALVLFAGAAIIAGLFSIFI